MTNNHLWNRPVLKVPDLNKRLEVITPNKEWFDANDPIKIIEAFYEYLLSYLEKKEEDTNEGTETSNEESGWRRHRRRDS